MTKSGFYRSCVLWWKTIVFRVYNKSIACFNLEVTITIQTARNFGMACSESPLKSFKGDVQAAVAQ